MADQVRVEAKKGRHVFVFETKQELYGFAVERLREMASMAASEKGFMAMALSGGRTPVDFYLRLSGAKDAFDWKRMHIFLVDERFVPDTDEESNYRMIRETLLDRVPIPAGNAHAVATDVTDPGIAAVEYEKGLAAFFGLGAGEVPVFDLVMLGMGEDGHTASLFPGTPALSENRRLVTAVPGEGRAARVTLTFPVINSARNVTFLVTGNAKAEVLRRVVEEEDRSLPATLVCPRGDVLFLCDTEAASRLKIGTL